MARLRAAGAVELRVDVASGLRGYAGHSLELLGRRLEHTLGRAEVTEERPAARGPDAFELVEHRRPRRGVAPLPVEGDREAVRLVADALQELQARE